MGRVFPLLICVKMKYIWVFLPIRNIPIDGLYARISGVYEKQQGVHTIHYRRIQSSGGGGVGAIPKEMKKLGNY